MRHLRRLLIAAAATAAVGLGAAASADTAETDPPPPPWVNEDGTVDLSEVPDQLPVSGPDGEVAGYVDSDEVFGPPPLTPEEAVEELEGARSRRSAGPVEPNDEEGGIQQEVPTERPSQESLRATP